MQVEDIASWVGQDVVDADGDRIGKLHEVYTEVGEPGSAIGSVKVGRLASRLHLVPLAEATVTQGAVRVPMTKDQVTAAPEVDDAGWLSRADEVAYAGHYGLDAPESAAPDDAVRYESAAARRSRREALDSDLARADEMEAEAARLGDEADELDARATEAAHRARADRDRQQQLVTEAASLRRGVEAAPPA